MIRALTFALVLSPAFLGLSSEKQPAYASYDYDHARPHEIKPHRRRIPLEGVRPGFNQLTLTLIISPAGDVVNAEAAGNDETLKFWPQLKNEVNQWKFTPFVKHGKAVSAKIDEYIDLVPPERLPVNHVANPVIRPDSKIAIMLERGGCYGSCPAYTVLISTDGVVFDGKYFVAADGKRTADIKAEEVRTLAKKFVDTDFYSMDDDYSAAVTDMPAYVLSITIDGQTKKVVDYVGLWVGMPAVITELENDVDSLANTSRWIGRPWHRR